MTTRKTTTSKASEAAQAKAVRKAALIANFKKVGAAYAGITTAPFRAAQLVAEDLSTTPMKHAVRDAGVLGKAASLSATRATAVSSRLEHMSRSFQIIATGMGSIANGLQEQTLDLLTDQGEEVEEQMHKAGIAHFDVAYDVDLAQALEEIPTMDDKELRITGARLMSDLEENETPGVYLMHVLAEIGLRIHAEDNTCPRCLHDYENGEPSGELCKDCEAYDDDDLVSDDPAVVNAVLISGAAGLSSAWGNGTTSRIEVSK